MLPNNALRRAVLGGYVVGMLATLLMPVPAVPSYLPGGFDKLVHVGLFLGFVVLAAWNVSGGPRHRVALAVGWAAGLAGLIELVQSLLRYRHGDVMDFLAGVAGAAVGGGIVWVAGRGGETQRRPGA